MIEFGSLGSNFYPSLYTVDNIPSLMCSQHGFSPVCGVYLHCWLLVFSSYVDCSFPLLIISFVFFRYFFTLCNLICQFLELFSVKFLAFLYICSHTFFKAMLFMCIAWKFIFNKFLINSSVPWFHFCWAYCLGMYLFLGEFPVLDKGKITSCLLPWVSWKKW